MGYPLKQANGQPVRRTASKGVDVAVHARTWEEAQIQAIVSNNCDYDFIYSSANYRSDQVKRIARSLGLRTSGSKRSVTKRIIDKLK